MRKLWWKDAYYNVLMRKVLFCMLTYTVWMEFLYVTILMKPVEEYVLVMQRGGLRKNIVKFCTESLLRSWGQTVHQLLKIGISRNFIKEWKWSQSLIQVRKWKYWSGTQCCKWHCNYFCFKLAITYNLLYELMQLTELYRPLSIYLNKNTTSVWTIFCML